MKNPDFSNNRYEEMIFNRCGKSGLLLPAVSLGLWHNFGDVDDFNNSRKLIFKSFDLGITHFDLANNYGPPPGSAEKNFGKVLKDDLFAYRDEMVISSKAGYLMWDGPYGNWGSKKYLVASLEQSLKRMQIEYVDIFYHHRPDPNTPLEETMSALDLIVRQGKALYVGLSNYTASQTREAYKILKQLGTPIIIHQPKYNMLNRWIEDDLLSTLDELGIGCISFSPLAQGILTNKYLKGIPENSRAAKEGFLKRQDITPEKVRLVDELDKIAQKRSQSVSQLALAWNLRHKNMTSVLIGARTTEQLEENVSVIKNVELSDQEMIEIEKILSKYRQSIPY